MNYELRIKKSKNSGYTLIETMIAISLFLVIVTLGMGALLNASLLHNKSKDMRSIMDSLSFTMDDMSRNLQTGYNYQCISSGAAKTLLGSYSPTPDNKNCWGIAFEPSGGGSEWAYEIISTNTIIKTADGGQTWVQLTPNEAVVNTSSSYFSVLGAEPASSGDLQEPFVTIHLTGTITYKTVVTPFSLQTSVSQRQIDI